MAYTFKYYTETEQTKIKSDAVKPKDTAPVITESMLRSWEAELLAHMALADSKTDPIEKQPHLDAIVILEDALTKNAKA